MSTSTADLGFNLRRSETVEIKRDRESNQSRGFGFITFDSEDVADVALIQEPKPIQFGKNCEIKKSETRKFAEKFDHPRRRQPPPTSRVEDEEYHYRPRSYRNDHAQNYQPHHNSPYHYPLPPSHLSSSNSYNYRRRYPHQDDYYRDMSPPRSSYSSGRPGNVYREENRFPSRYDRDPYPPYPPSSYRTRQYQDRSPPGRYRRYDCSGQVGLKGTVAGGAGGSSSYSRSDNNGHDAFYRNDYNPYATPSTYNQTSSTMAPVDYSCKSVGRVPISSFQAAASSSSIGGSIRPLPSSTMPSSSGVTPPERTANEYNIYARYDPSIYSGVGVKKF